MVLFLGTFTRSGVRSTMTCAKFALQYPTSVRYSSTIVTKSKPVISANKPKVTVSNVKRTASTSSSSAKPSSSTTSNSTKSTTSTSSNYYKPAANKSTTTTTTSSSSSPSSSSSTSTKASAPPTMSAMTGGTLYTDIGKTSSGLYSLDTPPQPNSSSSQQQQQQGIDWTQSFEGLGLQPFPERIAEILTAPIDENDIEIKPDGMIYLPEIKYRRILNKAFGPGGWGLAPRSETIITPKMITKEYALIAHGRLVAIARGEQDYFDQSGIPTATEGCKSNAMMRCCKDLGVASELWDPRFIRNFKKKNAKQVFVEYVPTKKTKSIWIRKDDEIVYPYKKV